MKIIDEKGKLFGVMNVVDLFIVLFVALVATVAVMFFSANSNVEEQVKESKITIEMTAIDEDLCDAITDDREIFDKIQNKPLGKLVRVEKEPYFEYNVSKITGEHIKSELPNRYNVKLYIEASTTDDLFVGRRMHIETKDFTAAGYIIDMEKIQNKKGKTK